MEDDILKFGDSDSENEATDILLSKLYTGQLKNDPEYSLHDPKQTQNEINGTPSTEDPSPNSTDNIDHHANHTNIGTNGISTDENDQKKTPKNRKRFRDYDKDLNSWTTRYWKGSNEKVELCFECGSAGHFRAKCPNKLCLKCKTPGHLYFQCKSSTYISEVCFKCTETGHQPSDCPNLLSSKDLYCFNCSLKGHDGWSCPEPTIEDFRTMPHNRIYNLLLRQARKLRRKSTSPKIKEKKDKKKQRRKSEGDSYKRRRKL